MGKTKGPVTDKEIVEALLDPTYVKMIKFFGEIKRPFMIGEIHEALKETHVKKPEWDDKLKHLQRLGFILRAQRGKNEHTPWEPLGPEFYQKLLDERQKITGAAATARNLASIDAALGAVKKIDRQILLKPQGEDTSQLEESMHPHVGELLIRFIDLTPVLRKEAIRWALKSKYFEKLPYT